MAAMLSGYRLMWILVMFDLPVVQKAERKAAATFRLVLLDMGFQMCQFSVYMRFCTSPAQADTCCRRLEYALPVGGRVSVLQLTDKQFERTISFRGRHRMSPQKAPEQFELF